MPEVFNMFLDRDELNQKLGGGLPVGAVVLLEGQYGSGKSVISQRFTYGLLSNGHTVTYITTELTFRGFLEQMESLNYPVIMFILDEKLKVFPVYPLLGKSKARKSFLKTIMSSPQLFTTNVTIFDTFSSLVKYDLQPENVYTALEFLKKITLKEKTVVITVDPSDLDDKVLSAIRSTADVYLELQTSMVG
ncbi:MAG TPA: AAA family ATPase, partial [Euryarchaeota archaeon]|nr:AAA family ATPase [Euryarchaeota archaeon]